MSVILQPVYRYFKVDCLFSMFVLSDVGRHTKKQARRDVLTEVEADHVLLGTTIFTDI